MRRASSPRKALADTDDLSRVPAGYWFTWVWLGSRAPKAPAHAAATWRGNPVYIGLGTVVVIVIIVLVVLMLRRR